MRFQNNNVRGAQKCYVGLHQLHFCILPYPLITLVMSQEIIKFSYKICDINIIYFRIGLMKMTHTSHANKDE